MSAALRLATVHSEFVPIFIELDIVNVGASIVIVLGDTGHALVMGNAFCG